MATFENPQELDLGRVSTDAPVIRDTSQMRRSSGDTVIEGLLGLGRAVSGKMIDEQRRKEFYAGQERILTASLEGTQKEELKRVLDEQPWYMQVMGPGAAAQGAVEMASKVGAGKMFDEHAAKLATGQDDAVQPDVYRQQVMEVVRSQHTGDPAVDAVFMPQLVAKGQDLVASQVKRHMAFNVKSAQLGSVQESSDAILFNSEHGGKFIEGLPTDLMPDAQREGYMRVRSSFDPATKPKLLSNEGWAETKLAVAVSAIATGDMAVAQAVHDTGFYDMLSGEQRVAIDAAQVKGKKENDRFRQMGMIEREKKLHDMVSNAKTDADVKAVEAEAYGIFQQYKAEGIDPPANLNDDASIKQYVFSAMNSKDAWLAAEARRLARLSAVSEKSAAELEESDRLHKAVLNNALGDNATADVHLTANDGTSGLVVVTKEDRELTYSRTKSQFASDTEQGRALRDAWLKKNNLKSMESLAYKLQIVDTARQGELTQLLRMTAGKPSDSKVSDKTTVERIGRVMTILDHLGQDIPRAGVAEYIQDEELRKDFSVYLDNVQLTGDLMGAWDASFGRDPSVKVEVPMQDLDDELGSGDVKDALEASGLDRLAVAGWLRSESVGHLRSRRATDAKQAVKLALSGLEEHSENIGETKVFGVPQQYRIGTRLGIRDQATVSALTDTYVKSTLAPDESYALDFNPQSQSHIVIPINKDGIALLNQARKLDYKAVKKLLTDIPKKEPKPTQAPNNWGNHDDTNVYGL